MPDSLLDIAARFSVDDEFVAVASIDSGHINDTYVVDSAGGPRYLLQRINRNVFRDPPRLMQTIYQVTKQIARQLRVAGVEDLERRVLQVVLARTHEPFVVTASGDYWRMFPFIERAHTPQLNPSLSQIREAGRGFGEFARRLASFSVEGAYEPIVDFHSGPRRLEQFAAAKAGDVANRAADVREEIGFIERHADVLILPQRLIDAGEVRLRMVHNDAKSTNVLLDDATGQALCAIDLDTTMPGLVTYDFGDLVRTTAAPAAEDEQDLGLVRVSADRLAAAAAGYVAGCGSQLTQAERDSLADGPPFMALIMATRFLTDYLNGDVYYKTSRAGHNLDRCRVQLALATQLLSARSELLTMLRE